MQSPLRIVAVWLSLLALLAVSVAVARLVPGAAGTLVPLALSAAMAALIAWHYMHLRDGPLLVRTAAVVALLWIALLIGLSLGDYLTRAPADATSRPAAPL